jgi:hypothetical protein
MITIEFKDFEEKRIWDAQKKAHDFQYYQLLFIPQSLTYKSILRILNSFI